jgi:hypothetical protein
MWYESGMEATVLIHVTCFCFITDDTKKIDKLLTEAKVTARSDREQFSQRLSMVEVTIATLRDRQHQQQTTVASILEDHIKFDSICREFDKQMGALPSFRDVTNMIAMENQSQTEEHENVQANRSLAEEMGRGSLGFVSDVCTPLISGLPISTVMAGTGDFWRKSETANRPFSLHDIYHSVVIVLVRRCSTLFYRYLYYPGLVATDLGVIQNV